MLKLSDINDPAKRERMRAAAAAQPSSTDYRRKGTVADAVNLAQQQTQTLREVTSGKRLRQNPKPLLNKLETQWFEYLKATLPKDALPTLRAQAIKLKLCNGSFYKPDMSATVAGRLICWETKGPRFGKGNARGTLVIKFAASAWPEIQFIYASKEHGEWRTQVVLP